MTVSVEPAMTFVSGDSPVSASACALIAPSTHCGSTMRGITSFVRPHRLSSSASHSFVRASSSMKPMASIESVTKSPVRR